MNMETLWCDICDKLCVFVNERCRVCGTIYIETEVEGKNEDNSDN